MKLIDGKKISGEIKDEIKEEVAKLKEQGIDIALAVVKVGEDPASAVYVRNKEKACEYVGIKSITYALKEETTQDELLELIDKLNADKEINGILVQLPLPKHLDETEVLNRIDSKKDVDGFHPCNVGRMVLGLPTYLPATPAGIVELLTRYNIPTEGKHCVVVGRSNIVGTPMAVLMSRKAKNANCTVTLCHSRTTNLKDITRQADILIVAIGVPHFLKEDMVKEGAVVVDVGIHRIPSETAKNGWKLVGDVDYDHVAPKCSYITPVPGGVGPMTIVTLLQNTLKACKAKH